MIRFPKLMIQLICLLILFVPAISVVSCSDGADIRPVPDNDGNGNVYIQFSIVTRQPGKASRTADIAGDETGTEPENFIDISDIHYLVFDAEQKFLCDITPDSKTFAVIDSHYAIYNVTAKIPADKIKYDYNWQSIQLYVMALANIEGWGIKMPTVTEGSTIDNYFDNNKHLPTTGVTPDTEALFNALGSNSGKKSQLFPMAGIQCFAVRVDGLMVSSEQHPWITGQDLNMLRSLVKIEVVDKINVDDGAVYNPDVDGKGNNGMLRIADVSLCGYMNSGTLLPVLSEWFNTDGNETQQVDKPTVSEKALYTTTPSLKLQYDAAATAARKDKCPVYSTYVFESDVDQINGVDHFYINVTNRGGYLTRPDGTTGNYVAPVTYNLRLSDYKNGKPLAGSDLKTLLRNHIYRFEVAGLSQQVNLHWTVCDMDTGNSNIEFN